MTTQYLIPLATANIVTMTTIREYGHEFSN